MEQYLHYWQSRLIPFLSVLEPVRLVMAASAATLNATISKRLSSEIGQKTGLIPRLSLTILGTASTAREAYLLSQLQVK
jgi:hypothetical protein